MLQIAGRMDQDPGRSLDDRLQNKPSQSRIMLTNDPSDFIETVLQPRFVCVSCGNSRGDWGGYCHRGKQQMPVTPMKQLDTADADSTQRISVVSISDAQKQITFFRATRLLSVILICHLQRDFDRGGAAVREKHPVQAGWRRQ